VGAHIVRNKVLVDASPKFYLPYEGSSGVTGWGLGGPIRSQLAWAKVFILAIWKSAIP